MAIAKNRKKQSDRRDRQISAPDWESPGSAGRIARSALVTPLPEIIPKASRQHSHAVLLLQGKSAHNVFTGYNREVARVLRAVNIEPITIVLDATFEAKINAALRKYPTKRILAAFSLGGMGLEIGDEMDEGN